MRSRNAACLCALLEVGTSKFCCFFRTSCTDVSGIRILLAGLAVAQHQMYEHQPATYRFKETLNGGSSCSPIEDLWKHAHPLLWFPETNMSTAGTELPIQ